MDKGQGISGKSKKRLGWRKSLLRLVACIVGVVLLIFIKQTEDASSTPENQAQSEYLAIFSPDFLYRHMLGMPQTPAKHIAVIIVDPDSLIKTVAPQEKSLPGACQRRLCLARLLNGLSMLRPAVIVLDMWFDPDSCSKEQSAPFWSGLDSISKTIPIVTGIGSDDLFEAVSDRPEELARLARRKAVLQSTELVSRPAIKVIDSGSGKITEGVVELDADNRKIPLSWPVYDTFAAIGEAMQPRRIDSLSVAAARAFDSGNLALRRVRAVDSNGFPASSTAAFPYTNFLREENLPIVTAEEVVCAGAPPTDLGLDCKSALADPRDLEALTSGKVVLIGYAGFGSDVHKSLIGNVAGVVLQANYVESILENRVYVPLPTFYQLLIWVVWLGILFLIPVVISGPRWVFLSLAVAMIVPAYLIHLCVLHFRFYTPLLSTLILAGIILFCTKKIETLLDKQEEAQ